ncbi:MerR family transcriptional regulator [Clostridium sp. AWRP]|uniref:MerR family transcriptional regulator n=1 Tax=Clostridium sp. AWRP TaxID=2212991 RepID=UPI000FD82B71|nr:MerR family transcriptional regulator [Clostridium sp. AWRP]AZV56647.1 MerR family transcriptional regulator [Clostridium sp. AWRP]
MENKSINISDFKINTYKTKDVAKLLNTSTQAIRNYCLTFKDYLNSNHHCKYRNFTEDDINKLKMIQYLSKEKHYTTQQIKQYFLDNDSSLFSNQKDLEFAAQAISNLLKPEIETIIKQSVSDIMQNNTNIIKSDIEKSSSLINDNLSKILNDKNSLFDSITNTKELVEQIQNDQSEYISRKERKKQKKQKWFKLFRFCEE